MTRQFVRVGLLICLLRATALADGAPSGLSISSFDPEASTAPIDMVEGTGVKIGEGTSLHPVVGLQTGVLSNVFYEDTDTRASGVLRVLAQVGIGSLSGLRLVPAQATPSDVHQEDSGSFAYRLEARLAYDLMLSGTDAIQETGGLGAGATLRGMTNPTGSWSFGFNDNFTRYIRAANFETDANTNRDVNSLSLNLLYHPQGRSLAANLYYNNTIDVFERNTQNFANRWLHKFGLRPMWRWLPQTVVFADVSWGVTTGLGDSMKVTSYPLKTVAGLATLLTARTTVNLQAGYENGFYSAGPSYSAPTVGAQVGYRYSPLGRLAVAYDWHHIDSVNSNFFRDHVIRLNLEQMFIPFVFMVQPELIFRQYEGVTVVAGPPTRNDLIFSVISGLHYNFRNSLAVTLDYHFSLVSTDYRYMVDGITDDPSFARHELLAGMRWAL